MAIIPKYYVIHANHFNCQILENITWIIKCQKSNHKIFCNHITASSVGIVHKIGIASDLEKRLQRYKSNFRLEQIKLIKSRQTDQARQIELKIIQQFNPYVGREWFILTESELKRFNDFFDGKEYKSEDIVVDQKVYSQLTSRIQDAKSMITELLDRYNMLLALQKTFKVKSKPVYNIKNWICENKYEHRKTEPVRLRQLNYYKS